jgi:hypothetical protein
MLRCRYWLLAAALLQTLFAAIASAQILNSERIEQTFGSYGIDVLYSDEKIRLSNLYSIDGGRRITRTLAIVRYPDEVSPAFAAEHAAILEGGSIGATFKAAGWEVVKDYHQYFRSYLSPLLAEAMDVPADTPMASHAYELEIARDDQTFDYALIVEIHHPDYLKEQDLVEIYGPEVVIGMPDDVRMLLEQGRALLEANLTLSE